MELWRLFGDKVMITFSILFVLIIILLALLDILYKRQKSMQVQLNGVINSNEKNWINYNIAIRLLSEIQNEDRVGERIKQNNFLNVAVYGMGPIGHFLVKELLKDKIQVCYAIDQNAELIYADIPVYCIEEDLPQVDAVIVTVIYYYEHIKNALEKKMQCPVVSLEDFLM